MKTIKTQRVHLYVPISRVDSAERIVEGYAFVNEVVPGEGGIRLKRSAMEAATADYMKFGALRAMHQPIAAGSTLSVTWDDNGAFIRALVVDDNEWKKVEAKVYKGFSVGVAPQVMRGLDVEKALWAETSLVDRPKDTDALFTCFRADGTDEDGDTIVLEDDEPLEVVVVDASAPPSFGDRMSREQLWESGVEASDTLFSTLLDIAYCDAANKQALAQQSIEQFAQYIIPLVSGGTLPQARRAVAADVTTLEGTGTTVEGADAAVTRAEAVETTESVLDPGTDSAATDAPTEDNPASGDAPSDAPAPDPEPVPADDTPSDAALAVGRVEGGTDQIQGAEQIQRLESKTVAAFTRLDTVEGSVAQLLERLDQQTAESESTITVLRSEIEGLTARIEEVANLPVSLNAPARHTAQLSSSERTFLAGQNPLDPADTTSLHRAEIEGEYTRLQATLATETDTEARRQGVIRMQELKMRLNSLSQ